MNMQKEYPYLYETHLHTSQGSACARNSGAEMARACKEYGYAGIIVTDHNWGGNTAVDRSLPWEEWVDLFCAGYEDAKAEGEKIGLDVFFGYEAGYQGTEFLLYGIDKDWMIRHPELWTATVEEQYALVHEAGGMVVHAHPFRQAPYIPKTRLYPEWVDGVEGINAAHSNPKSGGHNNPAYDREAVAYANAHGLPMSAGSDIHVTNLLGGGMAFRRRLRSGKDYVQALLQGEDYVMTNGKDWYDRKGRQIG
ncbi:MAG: PHP domain-containing protein [Bacteroidales bacterium]|nr:PHP domain-containing protein [Bacteroidales bacterium]MCM1414609.1 PHP domain-containing protein [bacterium]MCM1423971.1 PHP domain-containing protein [bacterium]